MDFQDYYAILGVAPDADDKAIKTAYRKLARKYHPDVSKEADAEAHFKEVAEAYEVLKSPEKRAEYDNLRQYGHGEPSRRRRAGSSGGFEHAEHGFQGHDFSDFFESIFGAQAGPQAHRRHERRGRHRAGSAAVSRDAVQRTAADQLQAPGFDEHGRRQEVHKSLKVRIPVGVTDGERIRLKGQGAAGIGGGPSGDLYLIIRLVPHPLFDVDGRNLLVTVPLAPWEAALGLKSRCRPWPGVSPSASRRAARPGSACGFAARGWRAGRRAGRRSLCRAQGGDAQGRRRRGDTQTLGRPGHAGGLRPRAEWGK
jgi:curved DNA-binding protein